ncbi:molybdopterin converting factor subunit 1 [Thermoflavimicrobium dichotomicum]|uniref:Molybdopterin synthase sulfur carrier subunit n=1 Tax=Thermoflavimicrobium dichotomicum TaxID=46223 RepID=A0A1I3SXS9_9BACL|nr:molybdopterin converting factor subunit 1 [Thermoflavimicrobium dichotomicum]SFJ62669.1 molybdopterin synthase catalytic subunit/molybdopterin synthase sulfur carrier subunit [Thermoflavimicrobium dichotomicum]
MKILCFADLGEKIGKNVEFPLETTITVRELREKLSEQYPLYQQQLQTCMVAINQTYAEEETVISPDDVVALIPPVSGG